MTVKIVGKDMSLSAFNQFKVQASVNLSRDDLKRNLFHILMENPDLMGYIDTVREKLITKGRI